MVCLNVCVCVCKVIREGRGGGKGGGVQMLEFDGQSTLTGSVAIILSLSSIPPLDHHPRSPTSRRPALQGTVFLHITRSMAAGVRFRVPSRDTVLSNFDKRTHKPRLFTEAL